MEIIVLGIIGIIIIFAVINSIKHFKGEGGCCGGGGELKPIKKKLDGRICARKIITIAATKVAIIIARFLPAPYSWITHKPLNTRKQNQTRPIICTAVRIIASSAVTKLEPII